LFIEDISFTPIQNDTVDFVMNSKTINDDFHYNKLDILEFGHIILGYHKLFHSHFTNSRVEFNMRQTMRYLMF